MTPDKEEIFSEKETLSSNSIFHFAQKREYLISILENDFAPRYYLENLKMLGFTKRDETRMEVAVPMVCFCNIPLSKIKYHLSCYGNYGIGMTKEWGIKNGVSPILYADPKSETITHLKEMLKTTRLKTNQDTPAVVSLGINIVRLIRFIKPYEGDFEHRDKKYPNKRFYDEREWRYVPMDAVPAFLSKEEHGDKGRLLECNLKLKENHKIHFTPNDVEYIIVNTRAEVLPMINDLLRIKSKYTQDEMMLLISKIISRDKITNDF